MSILFWFLGVSFAALSVMFLYHFYEVKSGKKIFSLRFRNKVDGIVSRIFFKISGLLSRLFKKLKNSSLRLFHYLSEKLHLAWRKLSDKVDRYFLKLRGRGDIGKRGSVSIYWQQVKKEAEED